jgi:hypothetical protein
VALFPAEGNKGEAEVTLNKHFGSKKGLFLAVKEE